MFKLKWLNIFVQNFMKWMLGKNVKDGEKNQKKLLKNLQIWLTNGFKYNNIRNF